MSKVNNSITKNQYLFLVQGAMIGIGILFLSADVSEKAHHSGWIAVFLGGAYPIYLITIVNKIFKNVNYVDFFEMCRKIYGKTLSYVFIILFFIHYIVTEALLLAGFANVLQSFILTFFSPYIIIFFTLLLLIITAMNGLTNVGRLTELVFYITLILLLLPALFINNISSTNLLPIIDDVKGLLKAVPGSFEAYAGVEVVFFSISFVTDKSKTLKSGIIGSIITIFIYTFTAFVTIGCIGWNLASKLEYPLVFLVGTRELPVISNLESLFLFLWSGVIIKTLACEQFVVSYCASKLTKLPYQKACALSSLLVFLVTFILVPEANRRSFANKTLKFQIIFIVLWSALTLILSFMKKTGEVHEEN